MEDIIAILCIPPCHHGRSIKRENCRPSAAAPATRGVGCRGSEGERNSTTYRHTPAALMASMIFRVPFSTQGAAPFGVPRQERTMSTDPSRSRAKLSGSSTFPSTNSSSFSRSPTVSCVLVRDRANARTRSPLSRAVRTTSRPTPPLAPITATVVALPILFRVPSRHRGRPPRTRSADAFWNPNESFHLPSVQMS